MPVTLHFTTPPFAAAFAVCFARECGTRLDMMGAAVCSTGVVLIDHSSWLFGRNHNHNAGEDDDDQIHLLVMCVALVGASLAGLAYMSVRKIGHEASANIIVVYYGVLSVPPYVDWIERIVRVTGRLEYWRIRWDIWISWGYLFGRTDRNHSVRGPVLDQSWIATRNIRHGILGSMFSNCVYVLV